MLLGQVILRWLTGTSLGLSELSTSEAILQLRQITDHPTEHGLPLSQASLIYKEYNLYLERCKNEALNRSVINAPWMEYFRGLHRNSVAILLKYLMRRAQGVRPVDEARYESASRI